MPKDIEIIPPIRLPATKPAAGASQVPAINTGGRVESALSEWRWKFQSRAVDALARLNESETNCRAQQTALVEQDTRFREALLRHQEIPERWGHELAMRRTHRQAELREVQHHFEINELRRGKELVLASTTLRQAQTILIDAEQQLDAQREYGKSTYQLAWKKRHVEMLEVELDAAERRALLRQHRVGLSNDEIEDEHRRRAEALADGEESALKDEVNGQFKQTRR